MHLPRRFRGRRLWSDGPVWAKPEGPAPRPELPIWATREFSRSLAHMVVMGLAFLAFVGALVWFITNPAHGSARADSLGHPLSAEQVVEEAGGGAPSR